MKYYIIKNNNDYVKIITSGDSEEEQTQIEQEYTPEGTIYKKYNNFSDIPGLGETPSISAAYLYFDENDDLMVDRDAAMCIGYSGDIKDTLLAEFELELESLLAAETPNMLDIFKTDLKIRHLKNDGELGVYQVYKQSIIDKGQEEEKAVLLQTLDAKIAELQS